VFGAGMPIFRWRADSSPISTGAEGEKAPLDREKG